MQDFLSVTGMIIKTFPHSEYDRRVTILTREKGKITAFVKGARRQGSKFAASSDLFAFGRFDLYPGKNAYNIQNAEISNFFEFLREDMIAAYYGMYFLELADYYAIENGDEALLLLLVYRALQGLKSKTLDNRLVRYIYELKLFFIEGEFIPVERIGSFDDETWQALEYIEQCSIEKLFSFSVSDKVFNALVTISDYQRKHLVDRPLNSLQILEVMT